MVVPDPRFWLRHKLWVSGQPDREPEKKRRDAAQAKAARLPPQTAGFDARREQSAPPAPSFTAGTSPPPWRLGDLAVTISNPSHRHSAAKPRTPSLPRSSLALARDGRIICITCDICGSPFPPADAGSQMKRMAVILLALPGQDEPPSRQIAKVDRLPLPAAGCDGRRKQLSGALAVKAPPLPTITPKQSRRLRLYPGVLSPWRGMAESSASPATSADHRFRRLTPARR